MRSKKQRSQILLTGAFIGILLILLGAVYITVVVWSSEKVIDANDRDQIIIPEENQQEQKNEDLQQPQQSMQKKELVYVFLEASKEIIIINAEHDRIQERIQLPEEPVAAFFHAVDSKIYIAHTKTYAISVFDLRT